MAIHIDMFLDKVMEIDTEMRPKAVIYESCHVTFKTTFWSTVDIYPISSHPMKFKSPSLEQFQQIQCQVHHLSDKPLFLWLTGYIYFLLVEKK